MTIILLCEIKLSIKSLWINGPKRMYLILVKAIASQIFIEFIQGTMDLKTAISTAG